MDYRYLAGLIDGDGCYYLTWNETRNKGRNLSVHGQLCIAFVKTPDSQKVIDWLLEEIGGSIVNKKSPNSVDWKVCRRDVLTEILPLLIPHHRIKKQRAMLMLSAVELLNKDKHMRYSRRKEDLLTVAKLSQEISNLNFNTHPRIWTYDYIKEKLDSNPAYSDERREIELQRVEADLVRGHTIVSQRGDKSPHWKGGDENLA